MDRDSFLPMKKSKKPSTENISINGITPSPIKVGRFENTIKVLSERINNIVPKKLIIVKRIADFFPFSEANHTPGLLPIDFE